MLLHVIASAGQINLMVPSELPETGTVAVVVTTSAGASASFTVSMASAAPGVFFIPSAAHPERRITRLVGRIWLPGVLGSPLIAPSRRRAAIEPISSTGWKTKGFGCAILI